MKFELNIEAFADIEHDEVKRLVFSQWDFQLALSAATFLLEDCDFDQKYCKVEFRRFKCFETTLLVASQRPFNSRGVPKLELERFGISLDASEARLLKLLKERRDQAAAHSDYDLMHFFSSSFMIDEDTNIRMPHVRFDEGLLFEYQELRDIEKFLCELISCLAKFHFDLAQKRPDVLEFYESPPSK